MKPLIMGTMNIDGEELTGIFLQCDVRELKSHSILFAEEVELVEKIKPTASNPD